MNIMLNKKYVTLVVFAVLAFLDAGCLESIGNLPKGTQTETASSVTTAAVQTSTKPMANLDLTPSLTPVGNLECQPVVANPEFIVEDFLLVSDGRGAYYSVDMQKLNIEKLAENSMFIAFSPYSQAFAYLSATDESLVVKSKRETITLAWQKTWFSISRWIDDENIQISEYPPSTSPQIALNPFEDDSTRVLPAFEDVYGFLDSTITWDGSSVVSYSPDLSLAAYPRLGNSELALVLVSTQTKELIVEFSPIDVTSSPQWSPDGQFVVAEPLEIDARGQLKGSELFLVGPSGEVRKLTGFSQTYEYPVIRAYRWSPDYSDIAFWFTGERYQSEKAYLGIVNTENRKTHFMCITSKSIFGAFAPVWSPNQRFLAVNAEIDGTEKLIVIDMANFEFRELVFDFNAIPVGWVSFKPENYLHK
jgi:hypothetical protein